MALGVSRHHTSGMMAASIYRKRIEAGFPSVCLIRSACLLGPRSRPSSLLNTPSAGPSVRCAHPRRYAARVPVARSLRFELRLSSSLLRGAAPRVKAAEAHWQAPWAPARKYSCSGLTKGQRTCESVPCEPARMTGADVSRSRRASASASRRCACGASRRATEGGGHRGAWAEDPPRLGV